MLIALVKKMQTSVNQRSWTRVNGSGQRFTASPSRCSSTDGYRRYKVWFAEAQLLHKLAERYRDNRRTVDPTSRYDRRFSQQEQQAVSKGTGMTVQTAMAVVVKISLDGPSWFK